MTYSVLNLFVNWQIHPRSEFDVPVCFQLKEARSSIISNQLKTHFVKWLLKSNYTQNGGYTKAITCITQHQLQSKPELVLM